MEKRRNGRKIEKDEKEAGTELCRKVDNYRKRR